MIEMSSQNRVDFTLPGLGEIFCFYLKYLVTQPQVHTKPCRQLVENFCLQPSLLERKIMAKTDGKVIRLSQGINLLQVYSSANSAAHSSAVSPLVPPNFNRKFLAGKKGVMCRSILIRLVSGSCSSFISL